MGASEDNGRPLGYYRQASHGDPALHRRRDTAYMPPLCLWPDSSITLSVIPEAPCSRASCEGPINSQNAPFCTLSNPDGVFVHFWEGAVLDSDAMRGPFENHLVAVQWP